MSLSPRARKLLEDYRNAQSASEASLERVLETVVEHPLVEPSPDIDVDPRSIPSPGPGVGIGAKIAGSLGAKIVAATVAVSIPAAWWLGTRSEGHPARSAPTTTVRSAPPDRSPSPTARDERSERAASPSNPPALRLSDLPIPDARAPLPRSSANRAPRSSESPPPDPAARTAGSAVTLEESPAPQASAPADDTLTQEVALLTAANQALAAGNPTQALSLVAEHRARFPSSRLAEARAVTRAVALCQAGREVEGRAAAAALLAARSSSPFRGTPSIGVQDQMSNALRITAGSAGRQLIKWFPRTTGGTSAAYFPSSA